MSNGDAVVPVCNELIALASTPWDSCIPHADALEVLNWLALPPKNVRAVLSELSMEQARWVMRELPAQYVGTLCDGTKNAADISQELERLKTRDMADRQPWQSDMMYWIHRRGGIAGCILCAVFVLWVCRGVLHLF